MIHFHNIDTSFRIESKTKIKSAIHWICASQKNTVGDINIILCSDEYLLQLNKNYLSHNFYTDIITFDYSEEKTISGDLFISIDRVKENAFKFHVKPKEELNRVIFHGVWHLNGFKDKSKKDREHMRLQEDRALKHFEKLD